MNTIKKHTADRPATAADAITMLTTDHRKVKALFEEFEELKESDASDDEKAALVQKICNELKVHAGIEEEIFYPAVREEIDDGDLMDEALVEHAGAKALIAQLEQMSPNDELYDAKVTVLGQQIQHHVKEEEREMFPKAKKAKVDTAALGLQMTERKSELMDELDMTEDEEMKPAVGKKTVDAPRSGRPPRG
jgi:hemerythrin superfamily protein